MKRTLFLLVACGLLACNKEQLVEGFVPEYHELNVQQTIQVKPGNFITAIPVGLNDYNIYYLRIQTNRYKSTAASGGIGANDSVIVVTAALNNAQYLSNTNTAWYKYNFGDEMATGNANTGSYFYLAAGVKKSPYSGSYQSVSQISSYNLYCQLNDQGYLGFSSTGAQSPKIYGWIKLSVAPDFIYVDKIGYRTFENLKAGQDK